MYASTITIHAINHMIGNIGLVTIFCENNKDGHSVPLRYRVHSIGSYEFFNSIVPKFQPGLFISYLYR